MKKSKNNTYYNIPCDHPKIALMEEIDYFGNIIPHSWYKEILMKKTGKSDVNAIIVLADIVYWYRPSIKVDRKTGRASYKKKFRDRDYLQKGYQEIATTFGFGYDEAKNAVKRLEKKGLIKRIVRKARTPNNGWLTLLFIDINPEAVQKITYKLSESEEQKINFYQTFPENWKGTEADIAAYLEKVMRRPSFETVEADDEDNDAVIEDVEVSQERQDDVFPSVEAVSINETPEANKMRNRENCALLQDNVKENNGKKTQEAVQMVKHSEASQERQDDTLLEVEGNLNDKTLEIDKTRNRGNCGLVRGKERFERAIGSAVKNEKAGTKNGQNKRGYLVADRSSAYKTPPQACVHSTLSCRSMSTGKLEIGKTVSTRTRKNAKKKEQHIPRWTAVYSQLSKQVEYDVAVYNIDKDLIDTILRTATDTICSNNSSFAICGNKIPAEVVKKAIWKIDYGILETTVCILRDYKKKIYSLTSFVLSTLYMAIATGDLYWENKRQYNTPVWWQRSRPELNIYDDGSLPIVVPMPRIC